jgi:hypothetical protein
VCSILQFRLCHSLRLLSPAPNEAHKVDALCVLGAHREKFLGRDFGRARAIISAGLGLPRPCSLTFAGCKSHFISLALDLAAAATAACDSLIAVFIAPMERMVAWGEVRRSLNNFLLRFMLRVDTSRVKIKREKEPRTLTSMTIRDF